MSHDEIKDRVKTFLGNYIKTQNLPDDKDLFTEGLLNSLFAMQLVLFVEKSFNIRVENEDLGLKNFNSINAITNLVNRKVALVG